jgi:hypothetical protein
MDTLPPKLSGFLRALCAIANDAYPEGGMSVTHQVDVSAPPVCASVSEDLLITGFLYGALEDNTTNRSNGGRLVSELRRIIREESGSELLTVQVEHDPGGCFSSLRLWWRLGGEIHLVDLFWSLD